MRNYFYDRTANGKKITLYLEHHKIDEVNFTSMTTFIKAKIKKSDDLTNIDKYYIEKLRIFIIFYQN